MIISKIQGGLGNQLFQWAYGKFLSIKYKTELFLDLNFYKYQIGNTPRDFELIKFPNFIYNPPTPNNKKTIQISDDFNYKELSYDNNHNYYLNGYWQSEKYFKNISDTIKNELRPTNEILEKLNSKIKKKSVSLHVRRTDYIDSNGFHPTQPIEYYNNALNIIGNYNQILIFSDDISWCKNNLKYENSIFIENQTSIEDLWLMSLCEHNIIANSSFSWWGAWLNNNENKKVIAPKKWFGEHANLNTDNIIPDNWIKL